MEITRKFNTYTYKLDNGKEIIFDLDKRIIIGLSKKNIKTYPKQLKDILSCKLFTNCIYGERIKNREYINKIIDLPDIDIEIKMIFIKIFFWSTEIDIKNNWKEIIVFIKEFKKYEKIICKHYYMLKDICTLLQVYHFIKKLEKYNFIENIQLLKNYHNELDYFDNKAFRSALRKTLYDNTEEIKNKIFETFGTIDNVILADHYGVSFSFVAISSKIKEVFDKMKLIKYFLNVLQLENYTIKNLDRDYEYLNSLKL